MTGFRSTFHRFIVPALAFGILVFGVATPSRADSTGTRAARLTYLQGTVTVTDASDTTGVPAQLNLPLLTGVQLATGDDGQAEVEFEDGSVVRLTPNSALSLDNLAVDPDGVFTTDISVLHGLVYAELRATQQYRYAINAGGDVVSPVENSTVRVDFDEPPAIFSVLDGTAQIERQSAPGDESDVRAGESLRGDPADPGRYSLTQGIAADSWDQWNQDLDQSEAAEASNSTDVRNDYAGAEGYGWSDLDANGTWYDVPGEGQVWQPELAVDDPGFDPYGYGAWMAYPGIGYVWASGYSWGWTPYRCGNWSYFGGFGWGWAPGAGCGGLGWGFAGGGHPVNIGIVAGGYRPIRVPVPGHGPERPLLPVRSYLPSTPSRPGQYQLRQIAGKTAAPIRPVGNGFNPGSGAPGSSLQRDFPVDSKTRTPVLGLASTRPAVVYRTGGSQAGADRTERRASPQPATRPSTNSNYNAPYRPAPVVRPNPSGTPSPRPAEQRAPAQRGSPPASHPTYSPPPAPHPSYSPPPAPHPSSPPPASHPSSSASPRGR